MSTFTTSNYIKKEQIKSGEKLVLTIAGHDKENVGSKEDPDNKWVLHFEEIEEKLTLNKTRGEALTEAFGSYEMDDWTGKKIAVYVDPNVKYGGKKVGGLAVEAVK